MRIMAACTHGSLWGTMSTSKQMLSSGVPVGYLSQLQQTTLNTICYIPCRQASSLTIKATPAITASHGR